MTSFVNGQLEVYRSIASYLVQADFMSSYSLFTFVIAWQTSRFNNQKKKSLLLIDFSKTQCFILCIFLNSALLRGATHLDAVTIAHAYEMHCLLHYAHRPRHNLYHLTTVFTALAATHYR